MTLGNASPLDDIDLLVFNLFGVECRRVLNHTLRVFGGAV